MPKTIKLEPHLNSEELEYRCRKAPDLALRSHYQILWLISEGKTISQVMEVTGYSRGYIRQLTRRYNRYGPEAMGDPIEGNSKLRTVWRKLGIRLKAWWPLFSLVFCVALFTKVYYILHSKPWTITVVSLKVQWDIIYLTTLTLIILGVVFLVSPKVLRSAGPKLLGATYRTQAPKRLWIAPILFLLLVALIFLGMFALIEDVMARYIKGTTPYGVSGLLLTFLLTFFLPWLLPTAWLWYEERCWRQLLGQGPAYDKLINYILRDFNLSVHEKRTDGALEHPVADIAALNARIIEFRNRCFSLKWLAHERARRTFKESLKSLNEGWRLGLPHTVLDMYIDAVKKSYETIAEPSGSEDGIWPKEDAKVPEALVARCALANMKYLLGDYRGAYEDAEKNWEKAKDYAKKNREKATDNSVLKWAASYAYFNTRSLFQSRSDDNDIVQQMVELYTSQRGMTQIPSKDSDGLTFDPIKLGSSSDVLVLNPILSIPRNILLSAIFNGPITSGRSERLAFCEDPVYWPNRDDREPLKSLRQ